VAAKKCYPVQILSLKLLKNWQLFFIFDAKTIISFKRINNKIKVVYL
jgi:hypothetical protein